MEHKRELRILARQAGEIAAAFLETIPPTWRFMEGELSAPPHDAEDIAVDTGYRFFRDAPPHIIARDKGGERCQPDYRAILIEQKAPGLLWFDDAGMDRTTTGLNLAFLLKTAAAYARRGYIGMLRIRFNCVRREVYDNSAWCSLTIADGDLRLILHWKDETGAEAIAPLVAHCLEQGFTETALAA